ncbi:MAG: hypothetical protein WDZ91_00480 [Paenibacillaceae bacterium]
MIDAEFMFYNVYSGRYLHLGVRKEESTNLYIPVTFSERKNTYSRMTSIKIENLIIYPESQEKTISESAVGHNPD